MGNQKQKALPRISKYSNEDRLKCLMKTFIQCQSIVHSYGCHTIEQ